MTTIGHWFLRIERSQLLWCNSHLYTERLRLRVKELPFKIVKVQTMNHDANYFMPKQRSPSFSPRGVFIPRLPYFAFSSRRFALCSHCGWLHLYRYAWPSEGVFPAESQGDFSKIFPRGAKSGEIWLFPLKTKKITLFAKIFKIQGGSFPPFPRPCRYEKTDNEMIVRSFPPKPWA